MTTADADKIHIFVGTDRSQRIGVRVLEYSIGKHTSRPFELHSLEQVKLPQPKDLRQVQRTGFSFSRFAIPKLMNYTGKAIYMDADMLVFKDIGDLWDTPFDGKKMLIQAELESQHDAGILARLKWGLKSGFGLFDPKKRAKQTSVSLLDCSRLQWKAEDIIAGLDGEYSYSELMSDLCILDEDELGYTIPYEWNSLEHWNSDTCNIHYTDMHTQPWVHAGNKHGSLWVDTVREMLNEGAIELADIQAEIDLGFARPSLLLELAESSVPSDSKQLAEQTQKYEAYDQQAGFIAHQAVHAAKHHREGAERAYLAVANTAAPAALGKSGPIESLQFSSNKPLRILYVANAENLPTLQLAFKKPLTDLEASGLIVSEVLDELMIGANSRKRGSKRLSRRAYINKTLDRAQPDLIVFCRYSGLMADYILQQAQGRGVRTLCAIDDDLLNVPRELGEKKYAYHNDHERRRRLAYLLNYSDLIYSATEALTMQLHAYKVSAPIHTAELFCPADIRASTAAVNEDVFGYMGFGHECDIAVALPGIVAALQQNPALKFELFGTIPKPTELNEFGARVSVLEPDWDYTRFLEKLAQRGWCVGLCPLADVPFNQFKVSTKWLEYSANGTAVIASDHPVYRSVLSAGRGLLVTDAEWQTQLPELLADRQQQQKLVKNSQAKMQLECSTEVFEQQFLDMLETLGLELSKG